MKKIFSAIFALAMLITLTSCAPTPESVELKAAKTTISVGETLQLETVILPDEAKEIKVTYTSGDEKIAIVEEEAMLKALAEGEVTITATAGGVTAELAITILPKVSAVTAD